MQHYKNLEDRISPFRGFYSVWPWVCGVVLCCFCSPSVVLLLLAQLDAFALGSAISGLVANVVGC